MDQIGHKISYHWLYVLNQNFFFIIHLYKKIYKHMAFECSLYTYKWLRKGELRVNLVAHSQPYLCQNGYMRDFKLPLHKIIHNWLSQTEQDALKNSLHFQNFLMILKKGRIFLCKIYLLGLLTLWFDKQLTIWALQ